MSITFNADEIFEMAEQIERNASRFYHTAAKNVADASTRDLLLNLAVMEDEHEKTFAAMRTQLSDREKEVTIFDPDNQMTLYLQAMAEAHGWEGMASLAQPLTGQETVEEILKTAIAAEKDSVIFYVGLKDCTPARSGKDKVEAVITEEMGHIAVLRKKLAAFK